MANIDPNKPQTARGDSPDQSRGGEPQKAVGEATRTVREDASKMTDEAKAKAKEQAEHQARAAAGSIGDFAEAVRRAGDELNQRDQGAAARFVQEAASGLENLSQSLSQQRPEEMLETVRDFGRRRPGAFVAGSVLAGIALGRLARSSSSHLQSDTSERTNNAGFQAEAPQPTTTTTTPASSFAGPASAAADPIGGDTTTLRAGAPSVSRPASDTLDRDAGTIPERPTTPRREEY